MSRAELGGAILKDVSRSFYLSLRFLPRGFREPASVGYLLARISDTIADAGEAPVTDRKDLLDEFRGLLGEDASWDRFQERLSGVLGKRLPHPGEAALLARAGECLDWMRALDGWKQAAVREVAGHITEGQGWDLQRFAGEGVVRLDSEGELDRYTYLVAGSVGEFWTTLGFGTDADFAALGRMEMQALGCNYGKGLQLVNIVRDLDEDARKGRCYLPGPAPPAEAVGPWSRRARRFLQEGLRYTGAVRGKRLRAATGLPAMIGLRTLDLAEAAAAEGGGTRVKVSRAEVRRLAWATLRAALAPGSDPWARHSKVADRRRERHD
ncbi:MAG: squalene/phytoene synthase family protein [Akkermansiaceae bacterium]|nr:squalene/phytoene synthase family protein [Akkermansiaceae bacterium]NNM30213.1 squalene/phytoene synthase family protein [Akkermansiaceae bacterium]